MAEHDNAGFPLSYCLLSIVTAIDQGKQTKALTAWTKCLKEKYGVNPTFVNVDKDMAEIGMAKVPRFHFAGGICGGGTYTPRKRKTFRQPHIMLHVPMRNSHSLISNLNQKGGLTGANIRGENMPTMTATKTYLQPQARSQPIPTTLQVHNPVTVASAASTTTSTPLAAMLVKTKTGKEQKLTICLLGPQKEQLKDSNPAVAAVAGKGMESDDE